MNKLKLTKRPNHSYFYIKDEILCERYEKFGNALSTQIIKVEGMKDISKCYEEDITNLENNCVACNCGIMLFEPATDKPKRSEDVPEYSVDVCVIDENNINGLAFYDFEDDEWHFHTDTLIDYNETGNETKWRWYYPSVTSKEIINL